MKLDVQAAHANATVFVTSLGCYTQHQALSCHLWCVDAGG